MKKYLIITILSFSSLIVSSQQLELKKASPFTAVKWENDQPIVQYENEWYHFEKLDKFSKKEILDFCKKEFGYKWQKRFSEDLVEVLKGLGGQPKVKVTLLMSKDGLSKSFSGTFTFENRQSTLEYNSTIDDSKKTILFPQKISIKEAKADLIQFEEILKSISSYSQLSDFDYKSAIKQLSLNIESKNDSIDINEFTNEIGKIMAEIGDRHSSVKNNSFDRKNHKTYGLNLPFVVATLDKKIIGLKPKINTENYTYYFDSHPYIKSINGTPTETLLNTYNYRDKKAPTQSKLAKGSAAIQMYGALLFKNNMECHDSITVVFSNDIIERTERFHLVTNKIRYSSKLLKDHYKFTENIEHKNNFDGLSKLLKNNIGYINIPEMYDYDHVEGLESFIENSLNDFSETTALIIDIRNNPGGGREILQTFARYIIQPEQSPWIANVAYLRTDQKITGDEESMSGRYLYSYNSSKLSDIDRNEIDDFNRTFKLEKTFVSSRFSPPFYMVLHSGNKQYKKPIYILVNEESFSAASVFTSAFKSLPNVKIVGETTDGSSGNSREYYLKNSNIRVKVSTMLSFQRDGKTLDRNGTLPDIYIPADEKQIMEGYDSQLGKLIDIIKIHK